MNYSHRAVTISGRNYLVIEDDIRLTVLDSNLLPVGQVTELFGNGPEYGYLATPLGSSDLKTSHGFVTWQEALDSLVPGLYDALVN